MSQYISFFRKMFVAFKRFRREGFPGSKHPNMGRGLRMRGKGIRGEWASGKKL